jgi:hypothetical protein
MAHWTRGHFATARFLLSLQGEHQPLEVSVEGGVDRIHIRVESLLDPVAIDALAANLQGAQELVLDFFHAPKCSDATLGYLFDHLAPRAPTLRLRGLSAHQERLLRYLGPADARAAQDTPSDAESAEAGQVVLRRPVS